MIKKRMHSMVGNKHRRLMAEAVVMAVGIMEQAMAGKVMAIPFIPDMEIVRGSMVGVNLATAMVMAQ